MINKQKSTNHFDVYHPTNISGFGFAFIIFLTVCFFILSLGLYQGFSYQKQNHSVQNNYYNFIVQKIQYIPYINNIQSFSNNKNIHVVSIQKTFNPESKNNLFIFTTKTGQKYKLNQFNLYGFKINQNFHNINHLNQLKSKQSNQKTTNWVCHNKQAIKQFLNKKITNC